MDQFRERRALIFAALECGAGLTPFSAWVQNSELFSSRKSEKLEFYLKLAYGLLEDVLGGLYGRLAVRNRDVQQRINKHFTRRELFLDRARHPVRR